MRIFYQGKTCNEGSYTRAQGLAPDYGYVVMPIEIAKALTIKPNWQPWLSAGNVNGASPITILDVVTPGSTEVISPPTLKPKRENPDAGFFVAGELTFEDTNNIEKAQTENVSLRDVYIAPNGIVELLEDLRRHDHKRGEVQI